MADIQQANPGYFVGEFGDASTDKQIEGAFLDDLAKAGMLSLPVTLIILVVVFGSLVAAGIPLLLALTAIFATFGLIAIPSSLVPIDETVYELILLIGLAVGVDYSMFYLKREREERAAGRSEEAALEAAASTSGRSVLISGLTVIIAMAGMFFAGIQGMTEFGLATIMVVAVAMFGSLTVLPAVLSLARRSGRQGSCPVRRPASPRRQRRPDLGRDHRPGAPPPVDLDRPVRRSARRDRAAGASAPHRGRESRRRSRRPAGDQDLQPAPEVVPR